MACNDLKKLDIFLGIAMTHCLIKALTPLALYLQGVSTYLEYCLNLKCLRAKLDVFLRIRFVSKSYDYES